MEAVEAVVHMILIKKQQELPLVEEVVVEQVSQPVLLVVEV